MARRGAIAFVAGLAIMTAGGARGETPQERGGYLVTTIAHCGLCHTPRDAAGNPVAALALAGGLEQDIPGIGHVIGPNITPDKETGIGKWSEAEIITALRNGTRPDGTIIAPPMSIPAFRHLSDQDAAAIAAYLHLLAPIRHAVARTQYQIPLPRSYGPPLTQVDEPDRNDKIAYGAYLVAVANCAFCHTPAGNGRPLDMSRAFSGGRDLPDSSHPGALTISRNITPDPEDGIGQWTDEQIKRAIANGIRPDGTHLARTMPYDWYKRIAPADLDAIVAFLHTVKPLKTQ
jgi:mono/diheme cytochrome c family protein